MGHINLALLGVLGLVQTVFLPGYLILRFLRLGGGLIAGSVMSFGLSLVANYLLVAGLVVLGVYRPVVVYAIFAGELMVWFWLDGRRMQSPLSDVISLLYSQARTFFREIELASPIRSRWLRLTIIAAAIFVACGFAASGLTEFGRIFQQWDAVVSWNRWAVEWAANRPPQLTSYYPQLLPSNISLSYVFMQTSDVLGLRQGDAVPLLLAAFAGHARCRSPVRKLRPGSGRCHHLWSARGAAALPHVK